MPSRSPWSSAEKRSASCAPSAPRGEQIIALFLGETFVMAIVGSGLGLGVGILFAKSAIGAVGQTVSELYHEDLDLRDRHLLAESRCRLCHRHRRKPCGGAVPRPRKHAHHAGLGHPLGALFRRRLSFGKEAQDRGIFFGPPRRHSPGPVSRPLQDRRSSTIPRPCSWQRSFSCSAFRWRHLPCSRDFSPSFARPSRHGWEQRAGLPD